MGHGAYVAIWRRTLAVTTRLFLRTRSEVP